MISLSKSLGRRMQAMLVRAVGSNATITFYDGDVPVDPEKEASARVSRHDLSEDDLKRMMLGKEPERPADVTYWRVHDIAGLVLMQGDWT